MDNYIRKILGLTDKKFIPNEDWLEVEYENHKEIYIIKGKWDKDCKCCPHCRNKNIIKHTPTPHKIMLPMLRERKTYLDLKVQRFICKDCGKTWSADCSIAPKNSNTSYELTYQIILKLKENFSRKDIAKLYGISDKTVERIMEKFKPKTMQNYKFLPKVLCLDEFRGVQTEHGKMNFICLDGETSRLIDILPGRTLKELISFFMKFSHQQRSKVKYLVMDMNASYQQLIKAVFPNAVIVVDRFHIVQHINRNLNQLRVAIMKKFSAKSTEQKTLKRFWKFLLIPNDQLNDKKSVYNPHFRTHLTQAQLVDKLLDFDETLSLAYDFIQDLMKAYKKRDFDGFMTCLKEIPTELPYEFKKKFKVFKKFENGVKAAFELPYSNGVIEGTNNLIKVIKRVAYGYRNFEFMRIRIKIITGYYFSQKKRKEKKKSVIHLKYDY